MKPTVAVLVLALSACSDAEEAVAPAATLPPQPTAEFLALDRKGQNHAVYDAFWHHLETNYYDPAAFTTTEWETRRAQWREEAAIAENSFALYHSTFPRFLQFMPESHVQVFQPSSHSDTDTGAKDPPVYDQSTDTLAKLVFVHGPGFRSMEIWRGSSRRNLVAEVWPDSPAAEAGVPPGARLLRSEANIDRANVAVHWEVDFVPFNAAAARSWERGDAPDDPAAPESIVRARFDLRPFTYHQPVEERRLAGGVQYLRFNEFGDDGFMKPVYQALSRATAAGLIVDLRWNIGGLSEQLQKFAGALLGADVKLADSRARSGAGKLISSDHEKPYTGPLVVLTGPLSASSAEVLSAAVQDHGRGKIIGRSTAGAVLGSRAFPLPDGGAVSLPVMNLWRTGGRRIEGVGVEPDIWILPTLEDVRAGRDPVLERALLELAAMPATAMR